MTDKDKTEFEKFSEATKHLMSVPKKEIDRRHDEWAKDKTKQRTAKRALRTSRASGNRKP